MPPLSGEKTHKCSQGLICLVHHQVFSIRDGFLIPSSFTFIGHPSFNFVIVEIPLFVWLIRNDRLGSDPLVGNDEYEKPKNLWKTSF